jgi:hypothetical protein
VVRLYYPDENIIEIGETMEYLSFRLNNEGLKVEEISGITNMPQELVNLAIEKFTQ